MSQVISCSPASLSTNPTENCTKLKVLWQVPVFRGSGSALVGATHPPTDHFGTDGLGDVIKEKDPKWEEKIQKEHAVSAMIRLVTENQNQVRTAPLVRYVQLLSRLVSLTCLPHRSPWWRLARSLIWRWLSDWIQVFPRSSKICTLWAATWKVEPHHDYSVRLRNTQGCIT